MKRQALQLLGLALREARQRLDRASSEAERKDIKEIIDIAKRFIYILRQVPYIDADAVGLSEEAPYKQMLSINSGSTHTSLNSTKLTFISLIDSSA
jgi:hypothetical protein